MKVLILYDKLGGVELHRLKIPFDHLHKYSDIEVERTRTLDVDKDVAGEWDKLKQFDVVIFNRVISWIPEYVFENLRRLGIKVVCDMDDTWIIPRKHPLSDYYRKTALSGLIEYNVRNADEVWVTHKKLGKLVEGYNKNWHVVRNAVDPEAFPLNENRLTDTHFWQGSYTHKNDMKLIEGISGTTICGVQTNEDRSVQEPWVELLKEVHEPRLEFAKTADTYHEFYYDKGIALIPLEDNNFTAYKSDLKLIEAGWFMKPAIVSDVYPYQSLANDNRNCFVVKKGQKFSDRFNLLSKNRSLQEDLAMALHRDVVTSRLMHKCNEVRYDRLWKLAKRGKKK